MSEDISTEIGSLYRIRKTINKMLSDRGYFLTPHDEAMTLEEFRRHALDGNEDSTVVLYEKLTIMTHLRDNHAEQIFVFWAGDKKVGVKDFEIYESRMSAENIKRAIIIISGPTSSHCKKVLEEAAQRDLIFEMFQRQELRVNVTEHIFVPQHQVLREEEKQALLKRYRMKDTQLPRMTVNDPIARYFGLAKGQVVKIIRPSETAGRYVTYRLVV